MKPEIEYYNECEEKIAVVIDEIENISRSNFYEKFASEGERQIDISKLREKLRALYVEKIKAIESLVAASILEKSETATALGTIRQIYKKSA